MTALPDFRLETYFSKWEFTARYHMCASDMESITLSELLAMAGPAERESFEKLSLGYTETYGAPPLRAAIAATYEGLEAEDILCFAGAEEGIYAAMLALLGPDDHAVVVTPNYQSLESLPASRCAVTGVVLREDEDWALDLEEVKAALNGKTKLIAINFPHNPTGKVISKDTLDGLVALARAQGIYILSDEVYRLLERDGDLRLPPVAALYERGLSLGVMSKSYGLPGLRIGWLACRDRKLLTRMERIKHYLSICNAAPSEALAIIALEAGERILARNRALIAENLDKLGRFFARYPDLFDWRVPDGGCIGYPRYKGPEGVESFCTRLVEESGVLLLPSSIYGSALTPVPQDRFRIGYGRLGIDEGLAAMGAFLDRNRP